MQVHELLGLDAQNPLGFFAALGLLRVLDQHAHRNGQALPRLAFEPGPLMHARIHSELDYALLKEVVLEDAAEQAASVALKLAYDEHGAICDATDAAATRDLKPAPPAAATYLARLVSASRRDSDLGVGLISELARDNNGRAKPTAFHFTAGQQSFLLMVEILRAGLSQEAIDEALRGPWTNTSKLPSLAWDSSVTRLYALRANDPSKEKRGGVPGANWLAVHALGFFQVSSRKGRAVTTAVTGGWKSGKFTWPVWNVPLTSAVVASLLRSDVANLTDAQRRAWGITEIFRSAILRSDQGGYGSFTPAAVVTRDAGR